MASLFRSLIIKRYSLKPVKYQITIQSFLIGFVCLLSVLPVTINDTVVQLSIKQALVFASMLSVSIGCVAYLWLILFIFLHFYIFYFSYYFISNCFCLCASYFNSLFLSFFIFQEQPFNFLISYFLSYCFKSPMGSLAILLLFPILVQPFIERVVEPLTSYLFYNIVADTILGRASNLQLCIYVIGLVCSLGATLYFLVRNQEVK